MKLPGIAARSAVTVRIDSSYFLTALLAGTAMTMVATPAWAQSAEAPEPPQTTNPPATDENIIVVTGIRSSLASALAEKREAASLVEIIQAEDIGKLPDQNLAEVLENVTGVQITRTAGVGTGVQIRGTNDNRIEINGVGTLGSGTGRGGINFEDINAAIISAVEVTKAPQAKTIEGSVGGTINLRTIRPLDLNDRILSFRAQGEYSELSDSITPRISASFGDVWSTGMGEIGIVLSGSYTQQEATSFRPRVDRDTLIAQGSGVTSTGASGPAFDYIGIQFLNQELENFEFETINFAGTVEWAPSDNLKFFFDAIVNNQERRQDSSRVQGSGVSSLRFNNVPDTFETINYGTLDGVNLGSIQAALTGVIEPNLARDDDDPNLRFSSDTGARITDSQVYRFGTEWESGRFSIRAEASRSTSNTRNPNLSTTLNFINPNPLTPLDGTSNDNSVPFRYDLSGGALTFGVNFDSPFAPTIDQLLDPNNTVLDAITASRNETKNAETAARLDMSLDLEDLTGFFTSFDLGYRYNKRTTVFDQIRSTFGTGAIANSPSGSLLADLIVPGPSNFGSFDGRTLAFRNFLVVDPNRAFSDPDGTLDILQAALATTNGSIGDPVSNPAAFFDIDETTNAVYGQANFEFGPVRGNVGLRWVSSTINSRGNSVAAGVVTPVTSSGSYDELLPRINLVADITDEIVIRASYGEDILRPDFDDLSLSVNFPTGPNNAVNIGNPGLAPETVQSFDASLSWYFAPASVLSVGVFHKKRDNLFVTQVEDVAIDANGFRDITAPCEGGGIFNPLPDRNVLSNIPGNGLCVPIQTVINDPGTTRQTGIELAFQYDLSQFENTLGFASGFGVIANYTYQKFSGGQATNSSSSRGTPILAASSGTAGPFTAVQGLLDFSPHAYNVTLYYEKYGISARARYTWRDAFRTLDTAGGASLNSTLGFPTVTEARGQLNASITYDVTDYLNIGVEGVNLMKDKITQSCVNSGAQLCFQGLPDRRITFGATVNF
ncbi:TonB-dependent receptor [hydrothermal vent metagenome]|uniref:TonB-dependent receptor n=1 Tax=hydrothermal vent metagenome TaxID=652676 RepID=A0A3B0S049_9ZZZZ